MKYTTKVGVKHQSINQSLFDSLNIKLCSIVRVRIK